MAPFVKPSWWPSFGKSTKQQQETPGGLAEPVAPLDAVLLANKVQKLVSNSRARELASARGLSINTVCWEDCARSKGSCWGPCISDMTLRCSDQAMPVIRQPNYTDTTWDVPMDNVMLVVGNEMPAAVPSDATPADASASDVSSVSLTQYLRDIEKYTGIVIKAASAETSPPPHDAAGGAEQPPPPLASTTVAAEPSLPPPAAFTSGLLAPERDSHALVSAQACFLPVASSGEAEFQVCLFNYQSRPDDPAVLVLVVSSQGTSAQICDGTHGGQSLWFNDHSTKRPFQAVRLKDDRAARGVEVEGVMTDKEKQDNVLLVIQVPLKQRPRQPSRLLNDCGDGASYKQCKKSLSAPSASCAPRRSFRGRGGGGGWERERVDVDHAIVKLGRAAGTFPSLAGRAFERDVRYPVRVTLQYYKCTSNAEVDENVIGEIAQQMADAQSQAEFWGSLVTATTNRPTEHTGPHVYANPAAI